jgi:polyribonucleotide nucleotidyltransferase
MSNFSLNIGKRELSFSLHNLAEKVNGQAMARYGDTVVFATVVMSDEDVDKGFFPLSVNYEEKFYAAGKISGSRYTRREGRPSDRATLISRMIDRAIRPLFPKNLQREIQIIVTCLSWDEENDPGVLGMLATSLALQISDVPWEGPLGAVRIGKKENEQIINPFYTQREEGTTDIVISGFSDDDGDLIINMIEGAFKEEDESSIMNSFHFSENTIKELCHFQKKIQEEVGKKKIEIPPSFEDEDVKKEIEKNYKKKIEDVFGEKKERAEKIKEVEKEASSFIKEKYEEEEKIKYAHFVLADLIEREVRENILEKENRIDGRKADELREIKCSVGILPRTHGSAIFERGETKSLSIITLGAPGEQQLIDDMELSEKKRFMHHYNFPPYSVGEIRPVRGPGRREIGHGTIGENGLLPLIPDAEQFPYTIRSVSEIVSSNGSTSMASVCGTTLALMDAGVPIKRPVAGISIGLVSKDKENYKLLTDIQGLEDHFGDMDFKVAGTEDGVTVIQMDVKIKGITLKTTEETLKRAKKTRLELLDKIKKTIPEPRKTLSPYAPKIVTLKINSEKIGEVIGPKGKTINEIIEKTGVGIDIEDSGLISVTSEDKDAIEKAITWIKNIVREIEPGEIFEGKVVKLFSFGAAVEILPGQEGLVHISEIADRRIEKVEDELSVGKTVFVKVIKVEGGGKISLSIKQAKKK